MGPHKMQPSLCLWPQPAPALVYRYQFLTHSLQMRQDSVFLFLYFLFFFFSLIVYFIIVPSIQLLIFLYQCTSHLLASILFSLIICVCLFVSLCFVMCVLCVSVYISMLLGSSLSPSVCSNLVPSSLFGFSYFYLLQV